MAASCSDTLSYSGAQGMRLHRWAAVAVPCLALACSNSQPPPTPVPTPDIQSTVQRAVELTQVAGALATAAASTPTPIVIIATAAAVQPPAPAAVSTTQSTVTPQVLQAFFNHPPVSDVRVDAGATWTLQLGELPAGVAVNANVSVVFNSRVSNISGSPDIDITVVGPSGVVWAKARAKNGTPVSFVAEKAGSYRMEFSNAYSRLNAKQVSVQFLNQ